MKNRHGFTLAEVLITLVIIGVIAAMTIPTLMNKTNEQETVVAVKKAYSVLSQAYQRMIADNGELNPAYFGSSIEECTKNFGDVFIKYLNVQKNCGMSADEDCLSTENGGMYKLLNGGNWLNWNVQTSHYKMRLVDGSSVTIWIEHQFTSRGDSEFLDNAFGWINVDVNGDKGPNTLARDVFAFHITKNGIFPLGTVYDTSRPFSDCRNSGRSCTAWVIAKGNMDYLRKDVSW